MKETYTKPEMKVIEFETEDVITTSGLDFYADENELPLIFK